MKKFIAATGLGLLSLTKVAAQESYVKGGPELGLNLTSFNQKFAGYSCDNKIIPGLKLGGVLDLEFNRLISLQPGLLFSMKGSNSTTTQTTNSGNKETIVTNKEQLNIDYLEVPVNLLFKLGHTRKGYFMVGGGPYLAVAVTGKVHAQITSKVNGVVTSDKSYDDKISIGNSFIDDVRGGDFGFNANAGYQWRKGLFVRGQAGLGLANIFPAPQGSDYIKNWGMSFTLGYLFKL